MVSFSGNPLSDSALAFGSILYSSVSKYTLKINSLDDAKTSLTEAQRVFGEIDKFSPATKISFKHKRNMELFSSSREAAIQKVGTILKQIKQYIKLESPSADIVLHLESKREEFKDVITDFAKLKFPDEIRQRRENILKATGYVPTVKNRTEKESKQTERTEQKGDSKDLDTLKGSINKIQTTCRSFENFGKLETDRSFYSDAIHQLRQYVEEMFKIVTNNAPAASQADASQLLSSAPSQCEPGGQSQQSTPLATSAPSSNLDIYFV